MSSRKSTLCSPFIRATLQLTACIATVLSVLFLCNIPATAKITYAIDNGEQQLVFSSNATELSAVLDEAGDAHSELDLVDTATEDGGTVVISKEGMGYTDYIRFSYLVVKGHLYLSLDNLEIHPMDYIKEGGAA